MLDQIAFRDRPAAMEAFSHLPQNVRQRLDVLLAHCADPDSALVSLERMAVRQPGAFEQLAALPAALPLAMAVFSHSRFLSEEIIQHPDWLTELAAPGALAQGIQPDGFETSLRAVLGNRVEALPLAVFRRRQLLRILLRDVMGYASLPETTGDLSSLADAILDASYRAIRSDLEERHGAPTLPDGRECGFCVLALGKLGGCELNYSSDIDLMFLYDGNGETAGAAPITNKEFYKKVANTYTSLLSTYTAEGMCYRVDLRLRPDGRLGEVCLSLDGARSYYENRARDWELQMLIKGRPAAGERTVGRELLHFVEPLIYSSTLDFGAVESVSATRERIHEKVAARRHRSGLDVKLAPGGIRDIEFLVQCLQRLHGGRAEWVRHGGTMLALSRLHDKELLSDSEYGRLASAYAFLRHVEHRLQFDEDRQTHTLPESAQELERLAKRMPPGEIAGGPPSADRLLRTLNRHLEEVQDIYDRVIHAQRPMYYTVAATPVEAQEIPPDYMEPAVSNLVRYLDQKAPKLAAMVARGRLRRGAKLFEHLLEKIDDRPDLLGSLDSDAGLTGYVFDVLEHSPYLGEQLVRTPELLAELRHLGERRDEEYRRMATLLEDSTDLRRFYRRELFRLLAESICLPVPVFVTLERTTALVDAVIACAYRMAVEAVRGAALPAARAGSDMLVVALGRLGMKEFDLASDADLVFVVPDSESGEERFWTRVAERVISILTAYTGDGVMFAVDTRLRPNGREGALVQTESSITDYFARRAEAWEGIAYMKSRAVAGDIERGTAFLGELQKVDWRRYGQSGRSRGQLQQMRVRLEKEQGQASPLKAGFGGYYDIDFALLYLRLKGAGIFFRALNTPERIDVVEQMGHLERADADFLRDAATLYRAVDHGLRLVSGQSESALPSSAGKLELLTALVTRWTPDHLHDQELSVELAQVRMRTREFFERLFG
ncbi:MAG: glutamine-synthetase adenylyltransferase [Bryobacteraceae bacterium]|nr:glutamine-synthetase adenylyltransferase [Bryobacteraceae bacterium]